MNRLFFLLTFTIYMSMTGIIMLLKLPLGHSWFNQWIFNKFFVFQLISVVTLGLAIESSRFHPMSYVRLGKRRDILRSELVSYYKQGMICLGITFFIIWLGAIFLQESDYLVYLLKWYTRYLLGIILFINIMSCLKWSNHEFLSRYGLFIAFAWLTMESTVIIPYIKRFVAVDINLLFSWIFYEGAVSYLSLVTFILVTLLVNIKISDKKDFI